MNQHDQMREALQSLVNATKKTTKVWTSQKAHHEFEAASLLAEQALAHVNETPKNEHDSDDVLKRAPLVRLTDEDVRSFAAEFGDKFEDSYIFNADGRFSVEAFANAIMDAMIAANK